MNPSYEPVGRIVGSFGIRGEVKVDPLTDFWARFAKGTRLRLNGDWVTVEGYREHKGRPLLKLAGFDDKTAADALQWQYLEATLQERPELDEDEFFVDDLIGMRAVSDDGRELGEIDDVLSNPGHDLLQIGETLIPVVKEFVRDIDLDARVVRLHIIPGMFEDE